MKSVMSFFKNNWFSLMISLLVVSIIVILWKLITGIFLKEKVVYNPLNIYGNESDYTVLANNLLFAMHRVGTKEDILFNSLEGLNSDELRLVFNKFGKRVYDSTGSAIVLGSRLNLFQWFKKELNNSEYSRMKNIWEKSGLPFP